MGRPGTSHTNARPDRTLWTVVAAATAVRALYAFSYFASPLAAQHRADQGYYRDWALAIAGGDVLGREVFEQGPLYAYLLALVYRICGPRDEVAIALQLLAGVATSALVFACARRLFSARAALFAGLACAAFGPLVFYEAMAMKTFLSPLLTIAALYAGLRYAGDPRARWLAAAGSAIGLACLVRENHVLLAVRRGEGDLATIDERFFFGLAPARHAVYGLAHVGMALALGVFAVALWRSLGRPREA